MSPRRARSFPRVGVALALACAAACALGACAARVTRDDIVAEDGELPLGFPAHALSRDEILAWWRSHADARDASLDLDAPIPYVETAVASADSPIARVGYVLDATSLRVTALVLFLAPAAPPPAATENAAKTLWGLPLSRTARADELYAPDAHIVLRVLASSATWPAAPRVDAPADVALKTDTLTFHRDHLFALVDGRIFFKRNPAWRGARAEPWRLFLEGVPALHVPRDVDEPPFRAPRPIVALRADADELVAVDDSGFVYTCSTESESWGSASGWTDGWGFPGKRPLTLDGRAARERAWAYARRAEHALWFEDAIGNRQHMGPMGTSTLYVLHENGQQLMFTDNGLPNDLSRELCGPDDGRFIAESLSASASALMLIDRYGRVLSRFEDYDLNGGTPNFEYTYRSTVRADEDPTSLRTSLRPYFLPLAPWLWHTPIPLEGRARISRVVTVLQTGHGNTARALRVAGDDVDGRRGYFTMPIDGDAWRFIKDESVTIPDDAWLSADDVRAGALDFKSAHGRIEHSALPRGRSFRATWSGAVTGLVDARGQRLPPVDATLDFNPVCGPHAITLRIPEEGGASTFVTVTLHTVDLWTPARRGWPGFDGTSLLLLGTLVFGDELLTDRRPAVRRVVEGMRAYHHDTFGLLLAMNDDALTLKVVDEDSDARHPLAMRFSRGADFDPPTTPDHAAARDLAFFLSDALPTLAKDPALNADTVEARARKDALRAELKLAIIEVTRPAREVEAFLSLPIRPLTPALALGRLPRLPRLLTLALDADRTRLAEAESRWRTLDRALAAPSRDERAP